VGQVSAPQAIPGALAYWDLSESSNISSGVITDSTGNNRTAHLCNAGTNTVDSDHTYLSTVTASYGNHPGHSYINTNNNSGVLVYNKDNTNGTGEFADFQFVGDAWSFLMFGYANYSQSSSNVPCPTWASIATTYSSNYHIIRGNACDHSNSSNHGKISVYAPGDGESGYSLSAWNSSAGTHHTENKWHLWIVTMSGNGGTMEFKTITDSGTDTITLNASSYWYWGTGPLHMGNSEWSQGNEGAGTRLVAAGWYNKVLLGSEIESIQSYYIDEGYDI
jgi:hypothetical protein